MHIPELHVGRGTTNGPVTVFPVWADTSPLRGVDTGSHAHVTVGELPAGAQVAHLTVTNLGTRPALLLEGELLEGGMQTRALAYDVLIAAGDTRMVEVACVENGRWHGAGDHSRRARNVSASVKSRLRSDPGARQGQVWSSIAEYETVNGATPSGSFADHLDRVPDQVRAVKALPGQTGVIIGIGGWPVALELFGSRTALVEHLPGIAEAAYLDAMLATAHALVPSRRARRFAAALGGMNLDAPGAARPGGAGLAGRTKELTVAGVATGAGAIAHLSALNLRHELVGTSA